MITLYFVLVWLGSSRNYMNVPLPASITEFNCKYKIRNFTVVRDWKLKIFRDLNL